MDIQSIFTILFLLGLVLFLYSKRKKIEIQKILFPFLYFVLYKAKWGLKLMDSVSKKHGKLLRGIGYSGVVVGFLGMVLISFELLRNFYNLLFKPEVMTSVGIVLPIQAKGVFYVPFFYWIISIFIIAIIHEFSHGVIGRAHGMRIKSSGFAFLCALIPIIPAAFVEPDEKQVAKKKPIEQLSMFAAGPYSNIILGFIMLGFLIFLFAPVVNNMVVLDGVEIITIEEGYPAELVGLTENEIIKNIDGVEITYTSNFSEALSKKNPGQNIQITTDKNEYVIELTKNPNNESKSYLGVYIQQHQFIDEEIKAKYKFLPEVFIWFAGLVYWLFLLNLGIGLFNLVPLGPLDGGKMLELVLNKVSKKHGHKIWKIISTIFLVVLVVMILSSFIK